jgi:hypothetical protein
MRRLPFQVYFDIHSYLKSEEFHEFLNTCNSNHFRSVKKQTILLKLNLQYSCQFIEDNSFHDRVINLIHRPRFQLCLRFNEFSSLLSEVRPINNLYQLFLGGSANFSDLSCFRNIHKLTVDHCNHLINCDGLENVNELYLCYCESLQEISSLASVSSLSMVSIKHCSLVTDISPLQNISFVHLESCRGIIKLTDQLGGEKQRELSFDDMGIINNFSRFSHIRKLILFDSELENVSGTLNLSPLTEIEAITLEFWFPVPRICENFSSLKNATSIFLTQCNVSVSDLSSFTSVISLHLVYCLQINDLSGLAGMSSLRKIFLKWLPLLTDITMLGHLSFIHVNDCPITSLNGLGKVRQLMLTDCSELIDLKGIKNNRYLTIVSCSHVSNFDCIRNCPKVLLLFIPFSHFSNLPDLGKISYLSLFGLQDETLSFPNRFHPYMVVFSSCTNLIKIEGLKTVPVVFLRYCNQLIDISEAFGENQEVELEKCSSIRDISCLSTVPNVRIYECPSIKSYSCMNAVKDLKVYLSYQENEENPLVEEIKTMNNVAFRKFPLRYYDIFPGSSSH